MIRDSVQRWLAWFWMVRLTKEQHREVVDGKVLSVVTTVFYVNPDGSKNLAYIISTVRTFRRVLKNEGPWT